MRDDDAATRDDDADASRDARATSTAREREGDATRRDAEDGGARTRDDDATTATTTTTTTTAIGGKRKKPSVGYRDMARGHARAERGKKARDGDGDGEARGEANARERETNWIASARARRGETILTKTQVAKLAGKLPYGLEFLGVDGPIGHVSREGALYGTSEEEARRWSARAAVALGPTGDDFLPDFGLGVVGVGPSTSKRGMTKKGKANGVGMAARAHAALAADPFAALVVDVEDPVRPPSRGIGGIGVGGGTTSQSKRARAEDRSKRVALRKRLIELENLVNNLGKRATDLVERRDELSLIAQTANASVNEIDAKRKVSSVSRGVSAIRQKLACKPDQQHGFNTLRYRCLLEIVHKQCLSAVRQLMAHKWGFPFSAPVDPDALGLPTYREIITEPMDLGTIKKLIENGGKYVMAEEVDADVRLTFANAMKFNNEGTDVHTMACGLLDEWEPKWEAIKQRIADVEACVLVERDMAVAKNEAAQRRADVVSKEKECAKASEALDLVSMQLREVETQVLALMRPLQREDRLDLASDLRCLPESLRSGAKDIIAANTTGWSAQAHLEDIDAHNEITLHLLARYTKTMNRNRLAVVAGWCGNATPEHLLEKLKQEQDVSADTVNFVIGQPLDDATSGLGIRSIDHMQDEFDFDPSAFNDLLNGVPLDVDGDAIDIDIGAGDHMDLDL